MSQENVELVRRLYAELASEGSKQEFQQRMSDDALGRFLHPQIEWVPVTESVLAVDSYRGFDGVRRFWGEFLSAWDSYRVETLRFDDAGDQRLERRVVAEHAAWHARGIASDGSRRMTGARASIKPHPLRDKPAGKLNVTDPDSRNLKTRRGWVQGYNAQAALTPEQIVIAAEISTESLDTANLEPMVTSAGGELRSVGVGAKPGVVLADAGYWKNEAIESIVSQGIKTLIAPDADSRKEPRPGRRGGLYDFTRRVLATDWGKELYLRRQATVEPVFGQIKSNRGADRFFRRGRSAVRSEWRLLTATHNLLKLHQHRLAPA